MAATDKRERYHHGDLRRHLLEVARDEIARNGAQAVTLASLARLAGVSQPAPYRHFADRRALLESVAAAGFDVFAELLAEAARHCAPHETLRALALAYVAYGEANIEIYRLMFASRLVPEAAPEAAVASAADATFAWLRQAVVANAPPGLVEGDATLIWAQLHGLVMLKADGFISRPLREMVVLSRLLG